MKNYSLKYRTFDQVLSEVQLDFKKFHAENLIDPATMIKVVKRVNYDLGLRIFKTKDAVIDIEKGRGKLPNDFNVINFAFILGKHKVVVPKVQGTHTETVPLGTTYNPGVNEIVVCAEPVVSENITCNECTNAIDTCNCSCKVRVNCKGEAYHVIQKFKYETHVFYEFYPIRIVDDGKVVDLDCPNKRWVAPNKAYIKDNFIYTSFQSGKLYVNYQGIMEDEEGNLLAPDHDLLNEYYEYAIKERILENLLADDVPVNAGLINRIDAKLRASRNNARSLVSMPDFAELKKIWEVNRKAQYSRYYKMFQSY